MSLITKFGGFWGFIPLTVGRVFFVAPSDSYTVEGDAFSSSNDNDGLAPERAFRTTAYALSTTRSNPVVAGDVIVLLPGSHTSTATITVATDGVTITGVPSGRRYNAIRGANGPKRLRTRITNTGTAGIVFTVTAADVEISDLDIAPTAAGGQGINVGPAADRLFVHDCSFPLIATASTTTFGINFPAGVTADVTADALIRNCYFISGAPGASGANGPAVNVLTTAHGLVIEQSTFELQGTAAWADAIKSSTPGTLGVLIRECDFISPTKTTTVITDAIDATGMTVDGSLIAFRCYFGESIDAFEATATLDVQGAENYLATSTGGALTGSV
jgi:hypothetical protein